MKRRLRILREARRDLPPYSVVAYRVRKDQVVTSSGLKFPVSFIKFFSSDFCRYLPHSGVAEVNFDAKGRQGFKESFCKYLESKFPPDGLFSKKSFKFLDSKDCLGVQLADLYAGSVAKISEAVGESNDLVTEVFSNTLLFEVPRPRIIGRFIGSDSDAHDLAVRKEALAIAYSAIESQGDDEWALLRVEFLKILVSKLAVGDFDFVGSAEIERILSVATGQSVTSMQLRNKVVGHLRDQGVLISSSSVSGGGGYKLPQSVGDVCSYLDLTNRQVVPALRRVRMASEIVGRATSGCLDVFDFGDYSELRRVVAAIGGGYI